MEGARGSPLSALKHKIPANSPRGSAHVGTRDAKSLIEPPPPLPICRPFWQMRLIKNSVENGGNLTRRLHVPKAVWQQHGMKIAGVNQKIVALQRLFVLVCKTCDGHELTADGAGAFTRPLRALREFLLEAHEIQNDLARPFPFIPAVETKPVATEAKTESSTLLKMAGLMNSVAQSVRKGATTVVERVGTAVPGRLTDDEMKNYADFVMKTCERCQVFDAWMQRITEIADQEKKALRTADGLTRMVAKSRGDVARAEDVRVEMIKVCKFIEDVICEIFLRDISAMLQRFIRKSRKNFARMSWDEDSRTLLDTPLTPMDSSSFGDNK